MEEKEKYLETKKEEKTAVLYDLSATDLLKIFRDIQPETEKNISMIAEFEEKYHKKVPKKLKQYAESAIGNPLLRTADIWTDGESPFWYYLYDSIEEMNEEDDEVYPEFSHLPRESWQELVSDYLEIGSDYGAGVVTFGIREDDIEKEDPPIYMQHEANEITQWDLLYKTLSDYLLAVTCDALLGREYRTSQMELEKRGWKYTYYTCKDTREAEQIFSKYQIKISKLYKIQSVHYESPEEATACCYRKEENILFLFRITEKEIEVLIIKRR